jgi:hypothetical protein
VRREVLENAMNCKNCGAPRQASTCEYCGSAMPVSGIGAFSPGNIVVPFGVTFHPGELLLPKIVADLDSRGVQ